jgi:hypothetical protein
MGFNRRKMEDQRREADEKEAANTTSAPLEIGRVTSLGH